MIPISEFGFADWGGGEIKVRIKSKNGRGADPLSAEAPPDTPEAVRWELNRTDSRNIAFVKGALVGMACAQAAAVVIQFVLRQVFVGPGPIFTARPWVQTLFSLAGMLAPLGIVIGGIVGRSRLR